MSVVPAPTRPSLSVDTVPPVVERGTHESIDSLLSPTLIPEVVINGKKHDSYQRPHKSSTASATSSIQEDGWGSNFWVTLVDPQTSTAFYACPATGQVSWDPPVGNFVLPPSEEGEWWELADESRGGLPYYYQTKTGETVWERPEAFVIPLGILQNTSLARRLSARFSIGAQLDGDFPTRPRNRRSRSLTSENQSPSRSSNHRDEKRVYKSSTKSSSGRVTPASNLMPSANKKSTQGIRRSSSSDQHHSQKRGPPLPTITGSDISDAVASPRKSVSTPNTRPKQETPPKRSGTPSSSTHNSSSLSRSNGKGYRPTQPQSLNAAVELFSSPGETTPSKDVSLRHSKSTSSSHKHSDSPAPLSQKKSMTIVPPSSREPVPPASTSPARSASMPSIVLRRKEISSPVLNREAAKNLSPVKNREFGRPILVSSNSPQSSTRPSTGAFPILPQDLASDIQQFVESDFAKRYFSTHRTGFIFRRTVPVEQLMTWQKTPMTSPLLTLNRSLHKNAVKIFKIILRLMGDREEERPNNSIRRELSSPSINSINSLTGHEEERVILTEALTHGELRDEVYCQVMKQLVGNPNQASVFRGWQLLCVFLVTFPPSKNFETYLKSFIQQRTTHSEGRVDVMAKYCLRRLAFISKKGPRGKPPSAWEIEIATDAAFNPSIFGEALDIIYRLQQRTYPQQKVPIILPFLADGILALGGTKSEGIFRVPGDGDGVSELKLRIDKGHYNLEGIEDPYVLASLMKLWLRELCDPLVPEEMYNSCITSAKIPEACVELVQRLPTINRRVVLFLISFLQLFLDDKIQSITKMTPANLALVMAPNLLRCSSESMTVVFNNAQYEQEFVYQLLLNLKCNELDPDYVPTHGLGAIATSSSQPRSSKSRNRRPG